MAHSSPPTRLPRRVAAVVWALAIACPPAILLLALAAPAPQDAWAIPVYAVIVSTWGVTGAFIATRRPDNRTGWVLWVVGAGMGVALLGQAWAYFSLASYAGSLPGTVVGAMLGLLFNPTLLLVILVPIWFPDGRPMSRRWSAVASLLVASAGATLVGTLVEPGPLEGIPQIDNPLGVPALAEASQALLGAAGLTSALCLLAGIASAVIRYRRGTRIERRQLKWFGAVLALSFSMFFAATVLPQPYGQWAWIIASLSIGLVPLAIAIAILRYRLYDIDRIVSRTIGWAIVTGLLLGAFVLLVLGLTAVLAPLASDNTLAVAGSTLLVAALFTPVRSRVQRAVDRRFDRSRYDGERLLAAFGERLRDEVDLSTIRGEVLSTVDAAVRPSGAGIWLRERSGGGA